MFFYFKFWAKKDTKKQILILVYICLLHLLRLYMLSVCLSDCLYVSYTNKHTNVNVSFNKIKIPQYFYETRGEFETKNLKCYKNKKTIWNKFTFIYWKFVNCLLLVFFFYFSKFFGSYALQHFDEDDEIVLFLYFFFYFSFLHRDVVVGDIPTKQPNN